MFTTVISNIRMGVTAAKPSSILWWTLYYFITAVLFFSGIIKIIDPIPMMETMKAAFKLNENLLILIATILPVIEIALGLMLVLKIKTKKTLLVVTVLFFVFFTFSIYGTGIGLNVDCGCFGTTIRSEFGITMIIRNLCLVLINIFNLNFYLKKNKRAINAK